jgi:hypothetical protein
LINYHFLTTKYKNYEKFFVLCSLFFVLCSFTILNAEEPENNPDIGYYIQNNILDPRVEILLNDCEFQQLANTFFLKLTDIKKSDNHLDFNSVANELLIRVNVLIPDVQNEEVKTKILSESMRLYLKNNTHLNSYPHCDALWRSCRSDIITCIALYTACELAGSPNTFGGGGGSGGW